MKHLHRKSAAVLGIALPFLLAGTTWAESATVDLSAPKQFIRGFGGMVHIPWVGDLSAAERTLAFGNADGQLGLTILRIAVPDGSTSTNSYVATAKAAIAGGGLVFATPWNSSGKMDSNNFATYADHLASFVTYMKGQGVDLYAISVQNEPDYAAQSGWREWTPEQCRDFVAAYGDKVGTKLMSCESFQYRKSVTDPTLNDPKALEKLGVLGAHLYGTAVKDLPYPLFDQKAAPLGIERWMTEHYTDSKTDANQWPKALEVATDVHNAMVEAQFNAFTWWYIKRNYGFINDGITKRGWCMAHWSKFVRPGFYRVDATKAPKSGVALSAYKSDTDVVIIAVNTGAATSVDVAIKGSSISSFDKYTTSSSKSLASDGKVTASGGTLTLALDGSSVTTLRGTASDLPATGGSSGGGGSTGAGGSGGGTGAATSSARSGGSTAAGGSKATGSIASSSIPAGGSSGAAGSSMGGASSSAASSQAPQASGGSQAGSPAVSAGSGDQGGADATHDAGIPSSSSQPVAKHEGGGCRISSGGHVRGGLPLALTLTGLLGLLARRRR